MLTGNTRYDPITDVEAAVVGSTGEFNQEDPTARAEDCKVAQAVFAFYVGVMSSSFMYAAAGSNQSRKQCRESNPDARDTLAVLAWFVWIAWMWLNVDPVHGMRLDPLLPSRCLTTLMLSLTVIGVCISCLAVLPDCTAGDVVFCVAAVLQLFVLTARFCCCCRRR